MYEITGYLSGIQSWEEMKVCIAKEMDEDDVEGSHRKRKCFVQIRRRVRSGMRLGKAEDKHNRITAQ